MVIENNNPPQKEQQFIELTPVKFGFPKRGEERGALVMDARFRTYVYPIRVDPVVNPVKFVYEVILIGREEIRYMFKKAYEDKIDVKILPNTIVTWIEYQALLKDCSFYKEPVVANIDDEWRVKDA